MKDARELFQKIQACLPGYELAEPGSLLPRWKDLGRGKHRFFCGNPRVEDLALAGFTFRESGYTLTFEVLAEENPGEMLVQSFSIHLLNVGNGKLFFHKDPGSAHWPDHPEAHIQFEAPEDTVRSAPFLGWRLPLGELDPIQCLEYLAARGRQPV